MPRISCVLVVVAALAGGPARADDDSRTGSRALALELFAQSDKAYKAGNFERAASLLREAYGLHPEPILLYNLARALEGLGNIAGAIDAYDRYLATGGKIEDRGAIERRVKTLREQQAALAAERERAREPVPRRRPEAPPPPPPPSRPPRREASAWPYVTLALGAGMIGGGVWSGTRARSLHNQSVEEPIHAEAVRLDARAHQAALGANVMFGVGGVVAGVAIIWAVVDSRDRGRDAVALELGPGSIAIAGAW